MPNTVSCTSVGRSLAGNKVDIHHDHLGKLNLVTTLDLFAISDGNHLPSNCPVIMKQKREKNISHFTGNSSTQ